LITAHFIRGQIRNWQSLSKALSNELQRTVYALDLRNHGHSPRAAPHNYEAMTADVLHFLEKKRLRDVQLLGHSMGGKVAMSTALADDSRAEAIEKLVVVDIAPSEGKISDEFADYLRAMKEVNEAGLRTSKEAREVLTRVEKVRPDLLYLQTSS
jgi:pimeloyl-ACP methyl ester carboxylesterase